MALTPEEYERLGVFYLGTTRGADGAVRPYLLPSAELTTHAVCVGMTGSGKTGLCLSILEEAAIDGIPVLAIDPKGDLGNLVLGLPGLTAGEFLPWIDADEARRRGQTPEDFATGEARKWSEGLSATGQSGARVARLRQAAEFLIFTPGSDAGVPLALLRSLEAPPPAIRASFEALRERVQSTTSALLSLVGVDADPVTSREHVLVATILSAAWSAGRSLDLPGLIAEIQAPPFTRIGVLDLASFYPDRDRFALVMALNQLLASPAAAAMTRGFPLDVDAMLYGPGGRPRISIVSIAHLGEGERRAFLTVLLGNVVSFLRAQSGTSSLRALLFMDEVAGYLPPVASPPTKPLFLTLFKQARAFGLGVVVATQNPGDVDYKVLANAGTWLVGRLQTDRDRDKVLQGLTAAAESAGGSADRSLAETIAGLKNRQFVVARARGGAPDVLETRFTLSYLRGPLSLAQIASLKRGEVAEQTATPAAARPTSAGQRPVIAPDIDQLFVPAAQPDLLPIAYHPAVVGALRVRHVDKKLGLDVTTPVLLAVEPNESAVGADWARSFRVDVPPERLVTTPIAGATFADVPAVARRPDRYAGWKKSLIEHVLRGWAVELFVCREARMTSLPGETERDFRIRLGQTLRERRDADVAKLREKYRAKLERAEEKLRKATQAVEKEEADRTREQANAAIGIGGSVLGALLGKSVLSATNVRRAGTAARSVGRARAAGDDVVRARENLEAARRAWVDLNAEVNDAVRELQTSLEADRVPLERAAVTPKKANVEVVAFGLGWLPARPDPQRPGGVIRAWSAS